MRRIRIWSLAAAVLASAPAVARADSSADPSTGRLYDGATKSAIQNVIAQQLSAFSRNDSRAAEAFAAPGIRGRYPEPTKFLDMVKKNYGALFHPKSTQFDELAPSPHGPLQKVTIVAADGSVWTAVYSFEQVEGAWKINGCGLQREADQQDI